MALFRVSLHSGDIEQKHFIRMKDASVSNPITKGILWMEGEEKESVILAVATLQFVRIYNVFRYINIKCSINMHLLFRDLENHELELVLPVGNVVDLAFIKVHLTYFRLFLSFPLYRLLIPPSLSYNNLSFIIEERRRLHVANNSIFSLSSILSSNRRAGSQCIGWISIHLSHEYYSSPSPKQRSVGTFEI